MQEIQTEINLHTDIPTLEQPPDKIPIELLDAYNRRLRAPYQSLYEHLTEFFPEKQSYPRQLFELAMLSLWIAGTQMIYMEKVNAIKLLL